MPTDTKEQSAAYVRALLEERRGAEARSRSDDADVAERGAERLAAIDAELQRMGHEAKPPARRAETRPAPTVARETR